MGIKMGYQLKIATAGSTVALGLSKILGFYPRFEDIGTGSKCIYVVPGIENPVVRIERGNTQTTYQITFSKEVECEITAASIDDAIHGILAEVRETEHARAPQR